MTQEKSTPPGKAQLKLVHSADKQKLACNPDTPPAVLEALSEHTQSEVLERVAENPNTPAETLDKLAQHESTEVRCAVTENESTATHTLHALASDESADVRFRLAENPHTPVEVLETLAGDENPFVYSKAKDTLETWTSVSQRADEMLLQDRFNEAEDLYRMLAQMEELLGSHNQELAAALHKLAAALTGQNKLDEALAVEARANLINAVHLDAEDLEFVDE